MPYREAYDPVEGFGGAELASVRLDLSTGNNPKRIQYFCLIENAP